MSVDQPGAGVLANFPLKFAGATPGVIFNPAPPAGVPLEGLPQSSFKEVVKRDGVREGAVQAVVDPPLGGIYLNIALYMKGPGDPQAQLLERRPVPPAQQNDPVYFDIYQSLFGDGLHIFTYEVERTSGKSGPSTESWALYHRDVPGGNDVHGTGDHPDLSINLPVELGDPPQIGKDEVDKGVVCTLFYPYLRAYDRITLELNRERFSYLVPTGVDDQPYDITITRAMFEQAGSSPRFTFSYTVVDQLNNPTDKRRWSKMIEANVDTERAFLTAPDISEDPDDPTDDPGTIDLGKVKDFLYVLVHVFRPLWAEGDVVRVSYRCTPQTGPAVTHSVEESVGRLSFTHKLKVPADKVLADSQVSAFYEQVRGGDVLASSFTATAQVFGMATGPVGNIDLGRTQRANGISPDGTRAYVGHVGAISVIDTTINRRIETIVTPNTNFFTGFVFTPDGVKMYGAAYGTNEILVIDTASNRLIKRIAAGGSPHSIVMRPNGDQVIFHTISPASGAIRVIDTGSDQIINTFATGSYTSGGAISPDGQRFYYLEFGIGNLVAMDPDTGRRLGSNGMPNNRLTVYVTPDGLRLYLPSFNDTSFALLEVEASTLTVLRTLIHPYRADQYTATFNPEGSRLYLCGGSFRNNLVLDTASGTIVRTFQSGVSSNGVSCTSDGKRLYVSNEGSSFVTVVAAD
ncbi:YncE family protein [Pseudomonas sp. NPDC087614]|uniref:YncE family protein n=1 Tax=Pseudomonas sp. NPDC087614 TaxID=3364442 RepID=UPI0038024C98